MFLHICSLTLYLKHSVLLLLLLGSLYASFYGYYCVNFIFLARYSWWAMLLRPHLSSLSTGSVVIIIKKLKSCRTGLTNHIGSIYVTIISWHWLLMPSGVNTYTLVCTHTDMKTKAISRKHVHEPGLKIRLLFSSQLVTIATYIILTWIKPKHFTTKYFNSMYVGIATKKFNSSFL